MPQLRNTSGHAVVASPVGMLRPRVEFPVGDGQRSIAITYEDRAVVARPHAVCRNAIELDPAQIDPCFLQGFAGLLLSAPAVDQDSDPLAMIKVPDDLGVN